MSQVEESLERAGCHNVKVIILLFLDLRVNLKRDKNNCNQHASMLLKYQ